MCMYKKYIRVQFFYALGRALSTVSKSHWDSSFSPFFFFFLIKQTVCQRMENLTACLS